MMRVAVSIGACAIALASFSGNAADNSASAVIQHYGLEQAETPVKERKGWRWAAEMEEIADTFAAAGLPDGFHRAAAEIYRRPGNVGRRDDS